MYRESILVFSSEKGFGEVLWITCPSCWNTMKVTLWEDGTEEEVCACCRLRQHEILKP